MSGPLSLLEFILNLLRDPREQADFNRNPQQVLHDNGFDKLCAADVHEALPMVVEAAQSGQPYDGGTASAEPHSGNPVSLPGAGGLEGAIRNIQYITDNYSFADSHNTMLDNSVNQNIWANGDVYQTFDNSPSVASGAGAVAAGHDVSGPVATGDHDVAGNGNATGTGAMADNGSGPANFGSGSATSVGSVTAGHGSAVAFGSGSATGSMTSTTDSHNITTTDSNDTVDSHNTTDSHNTADSHNLTDTHDSSLTELGSHDTSTTTTSTTDVDSHNHQDYDQHDDDHSHHLIDIGIGLL